MTTEKLEEKWEEIRVSSCVPGTEYVAGYKATVLAVFAGCIFPYKKEGCVTQTQGVC